MYLSRKNYYLSFYAHTISLLKITKIIVFYRQFIRYLFVFQIIFSLLIIYNLMKIRRNDSYDSNYFFKLKQLYFFKILLYQYDLSLVKDYIKKSLDIIIFKQNLQINLDHINYVYILSQETLISINNNSENVIVKQGRKIQAHILSLKTQNQVLVYKLKRNTVLLLQSLYFLDIPFLRNMKSQQKLAFLQNCECLTQNFNSFIYRKGDCLDAVYFLMKGQIKMYKEVNERIYEVNTLQNNRLFGLFEIKSGLSSRELYAKSNVNDLQVLRIPIQLIQEISGQQQLSIVDYISNLKSELHSTVKNQLNCRQTHKSIQQKNNIRMIRKSENLLTTRQFTNRLKTFEINRNLNDKVLNNVLQSKMLMLKVKELNLRVQKSLQNSQKSQNNAYFIKHFNDKWRKQKDLKHIHKKTLQSKYNYMTRSNQSSKFGIKGLQKYPAYKRYIMSRQQNFRKTNQIQSNIDSYQVI